MTDGRRRGSAPRSAGYGVPLDLVVVLLLTGISLATVFLPGLRETPFRFVFGLLLVVFLPGYAAVAAVFPERNTPDPDRSTTPPGDASTRSPRQDQLASRSIDGLERGLLSVGLSCVIVVLAGLVLNYTPWGIGLVPLAVVLTAITGTMTIIAGIRRHRLDHSDRFHLPTGAWVGGAYRELANPKSKTDALLNLVIVIAIIVAATSFGYAATVPSNGEQYTELYILTQDDESDLVAAEYPQELESGENYSLIVGITNQERQTREYSIVVEQQRVETDGNETTVSDRQELSRQRTSVANNDTRYLEIEVQPGMTGENQRVAVMLYIGDPPAEPGLDNAYRSVHIWVDVADGA